MSGREDPALRVLFSDDRLIAIDKPSGMVVHRGWGQDTVTVADIVRDKIVHDKVHAIHRLDRGTSGVLLFALDPDAARQCQVALESGSAASKRYLALVRGPFREACLLDHAIPNRKGGDRVPAVTEFVPLLTQDRWSLVEARPRTGRLHQIRRHLKHLSCPVVGDVRYGKGDINKVFREQYQLSRLALHAFELIIDHPDGTKLVLHAPLPDDLVKPLEQLGFDLASISAHLV